MTIVLLPKGPQPASGASLPFAASAFKELKLWLDVATDMGQEVEFLAQVQRAPTSDGPWTATSGGCRLNCATRGHRPPLGRYPLGTRIVTAEPWLRITWEARATRNINARGVDLVLGVEGEAT